MTEELDELHSLETKTEKVKRLAKSAGRGALNAHADWSEGLVHAATGGRRGMTILEARQYRREQQGSEVSHSQTSA